MILVDPPSWEGWDTTWSHLVSDVSLEELHDFARRVGLPQRLFDLDHYDVPARRYDEVVAAGAVPVSGRELISRLRASGLRVTEAQRRRGTYRDHRTTTTSEEEERTMLIYGFESYGGPEVQGFREVPAPEAAPGTVLVRMRAVGVNPADIKVRDGQRKDTVEVRFPMAMGREAAGTVLADPSGTFAEGERVFGSSASGHGALGELVLLDLAQTARTPEEVTDERAACIPVALGTAWDAVQELGIGRESTLLVVGAGGGVGIHAVQLARHLGARVIGVASEGKRDLVTGYGAEHVVSGDGWVERVREIAPDGVDAVLDAVGGEVLRAAAGLVTDPSRIRSTASFALARELGGGPVTRRRSTEVYAQIADLVAAGAVEPVIRAVFPLSGAPAAIARVEGGHSTGKTVVTA